MRLPWLANELRLVDERFEAEPLRTILTDFVALAEEATPEEIQRLLRLIVRRVEWFPDGSRYVEFYHMPKSRRGTQVLRLDDWLENNVRLGCPLHRSVEPLLLDVEFNDHGIPDPHSALLMMARSKTLY